MLRSYFSCCQENILFKKCVLSITIITNLTNYFQIVRYSNRNHEPNANIHHLVMVIVMMLTTMQVVIMIEEIVMNDKFENALNVNVLTKTAPYANVLTLAMNNVKNIFTTLIIKICYSCAKI